MNYFLIIQVFLRFEDEDRENILTKSNELIELLSSPAPIVESTGDKTILSLEEYLEKDSRFKFTSEYLEVINS